MRKKFMFIVAGVMLAALIFPGINGTYAAAGGFINVSNASVSEASGVTTVTFPTGNATVKYDGTLDFEAGKKLTFTLASASFKIASACTEYVEFKISSGGSGFRAVYYPMYSGIQTNVDKGRFDVYYFTSAKETFFESILSYGAALGDHTVSLEKYNGINYLTVDGFVATPQAAANGFSLSAAELQIKAVSTHASPQFQIKGITDASKAFLTGEWASLGGSTVTENFDGTKKFTVNDKWTEKHNGQAVLFMRESITNVKGYDVTQPVVIDMHYDTAHATAVWWGVGMAKKPFDKLPLYKVTDGIANELSADDLSHNFGIMFQTTSGKAEPYYDNLDLKYYSDNGGGVMYTSRDMLNRLEYRIGETNTQIFWNGKELFKDYPMKRSDFADGKVYPYFKFIATPATKNLYNMITIKGINVPKAEEVSFRILKYTTQNLDVDFTVAADNGNIVLLDSAKQPVAASNYTLASGKITINSAYLRSLPLGDNKLYISNDGGVECLFIKILEDEVEILKPEPAQSEYSFTEKSFEADAEFKIDIKNGAFDRLTGNGIGSAKYSFETGGGSTTGTLTIRKDFLNNLAAGTYTFTVKTVNPDDDTAPGAEGSLVIKITKEGGGTEDPGGNGDGPGDNGGGCKNKADAVILLPLIAAAALASKKRFK